MKNAKSIFRKKEEKYGTHEMGNSYFIDVLKGQACKSYLIYH